MKKGLAPFFLLLILPLLSHGQSPFKQGEIIDYHIVYHWGLMWVDAGTVQFTVSDTLIEDNKSAFYFRGQGRTLPRWDWFYKVRDTYAAVATKEDLQSIHFYRSVREGNTFIERTYSIDKATNTIIQEDQSKKGKLSKDTIPFMPNTFDVLSLIYQTRTISFENYTAGDRINIRLLLDGKIYDSYITFEGEEWVEVQGKGYIYCYHFKPKLIEGTIFPGGEHMDVWVTKNESKVPVLIKTPILVGDIEVHLKNAVQTTTNLRFYEDKPE